MGIREWSHFNERFSRRPAAGESSLASNMGFYIIIYIVLSLLFVYRSEGSEEGEGSYARFSPVGYIT